MEHKDYVAHVDCHACGNSYDQRETHHSDYLGGYMLSPRCCGACGCDDARVIITITVCECEACMEYKLNC
jgi:hypothetical protein